MTFIKIGNLILSYQTLEIGNYTLTSPKFVQQAKLPKILKQNLKIDNSDNTHPKFMKICMKLPNMIECYSRNFIILFQKVL